MTSLTSLLNIGNATQPQATALTPNPSPSNPGTGGMSFGDVLDAINPLQHIPVLSNLYRAATGSQISGGAQIAGDTLYGAAFGGISALMGFASSVTNVAVKSATGEDIGQHVVATIGAVGGTSPSTPASTATPLVASGVALRIMPPVQPGDTSTFEGQMQNAGRVLGHNGSDKSNAQYQRTQALDAINKHLLHISG